MRGPSVEDCWSLSAVELGRAYDARELSTG